MTATHGKKHAAQPLTATIEVQTTKISGQAPTDFTDMLSVEEPLEIRLTAEVNGHELTRPVAITMRTPGEDRDLAAGFLFTEGIISDIEQIESVESDGCNVIAIKLRAGVDVPPAVFERHSFVASSCGDRRRPGAPQLQTISWATKSLCDSHTRPP
jgi:FdhD protein